MALAVLAVFVGIGVWAILTSDFEEEESSAGIRVSEEEFGEDWPFTVPEGTLNCEKGPVDAPEFSWFTFEHDGTTYALNSVVLGTVGGRKGWSDVQPIWKQYLRTTTPGVPDLKIMVDISPMVRLAMEQCEESPLGMEAAFSLSAGFRRGNS